MRVMIKLLYLPSNSSSKPHNVCVCYAYYLSLHFTAGERIRLASDFTKDYSQLRTTAVSQQSYTFLLAACDSAFIALSELFGVTDIRTYEIGLGVYNGGKPNDVVIKRNGVVRSRETGTGP